MEAVDILPRIDGRDHRLLHGLVRQRQLDKNAVDSRVMVECVHHVQDLLPRGRRRQQDFRGINSYLCARLFLAGHIGTRGRIVADEQDAQARHDSAGFQFRNLAGQFRPHLLRNRFSIQNFRRHVSLSLSGSVVKMDVHFTRRRRQAQAPLFG